MHQQTNGPRRWLDFTINVQQLVRGILTVAAVGCVTYYGIIGRLQALETKDIAHDARFARLDSDIRQQRQDIKEQLDSIQTDVREIRGVILRNNAESRPDIRRWAK